MKALPRFQYKRGWLKNYPLFLMALLQRPFVPENCGQVFGMHKRFWREVEACLFGGFLGEVREPLPRKMLPH